MSRLFFFVLFIAVVGSTPFTQLINALFSRSNLDSAVQPKYASNGIGFTAGNCSGSFPALADVQYVLKKGSINFCYNKNIGFPFNNGTAGYEVDAVSSWTNLITSQYQTSINVIFVDIPTGASGLFPSLLAALNAGTCDGIMSSIFRTANRSAVAEASCAYGTSLPGFARGTYQPSVNISTVQQLNASGIRIGSISGTVYQTYTTLFPSATFYFVTNFTDLYALNSNGTVHAILYDAPTLFDRAVNAPQTLCGSTSCRVVSFTPGFDMVVYSNLTAPSTVSSKRAIVEEFHSSACVMGPITLLIGILALF